MDEADVVAYNTLTDQYLKKFGNFIENHFCTLVRTVSEDACRGSSGRANGNLSSSSGDYSSSDVSTTAGEQSTNSVTLHTSSHHIWNNLLHPIKLRWTPIAESANFEELTCIPHPLDGNPDVQKVMLVLVTITNQARSLKEVGYRTFLQAILLYGDGYDSDSGSSSEAPSLAETEGEGHVSIARLIPLLLELLEFIQECTEFVGHWMLQLAALFKESKPHVVAISNLQLYTVFKELSDLLGFLVILDEVIRSQVVLQEHWLKYRQMIKSVRADSRSFDTEAGNLVQLDRDLIQIDKYILSANIFRNFVDSVLQQNHRYFSRNLVLAEKFQSFLITLASNLDKDFVNHTEEFRPVSLAATYIFAAFLFPAGFDTKRQFQKVMLEHLRRIQAVAITGSHIWLPEVFFTSCVQGNGSKLFDSRAIQSISSSRQSFLQQKVSSLAKDKGIQYSSWALRLQEVLFMKELSGINMADLSRKCTLIVEGTKLAQNLSQNFRLILNLHASMGKPIGKNVVVHLCQMLELLKSIQGTFFQFNVRLCCSTMYIVQYVMHTALVHIRAAQKSILNMSDNRKVDETRADALSVLKILEHCLRGSISGKRLLVAQIALDWASSSNRFWRDDETSMILPAAMDRIDQLVNLERSVDHYCNCSLVYFHRVILSTYFSSLYVNPQDSSKLPLIFLIIRDCLALLRGSPHSEHAERVFMADIESYLKTQFIERLCQDVETDLRILSHTHLQVEAVDPVSPFRSGVKELENIMEIPNFSSDNVNNVSMKSIVEHYMSKTFYNLASVALHDWQSYATMRVLAWDKYKLHILDDHLPGHSLEQGRDILEIVRNLPQFVAEFTYNLNNQVFVQVNSPNKHLDTVNIRHLANSLRTHGPGMANTTINFTYRFLRSKIHNLSQFLYDEQIKSRLSKDIRLFKQSYQEPTAAAQNYTYATLLFDRAMKFKKGIRKLGLTQDGLSPLDQFRILISHIGNALGFVRLVRSGGSHFLAGGYQFVPDLQDITLFSELVESATELEPSSWSNDIKSAAVGIDSAIKTLSNSFSDGIDYFKLLVNAFQPTLLDARNSHLKNFYGIIPALTLSYVDHMRLSKEKLAKRSKSSTIFTDDGFPMGVAYLLKVLNQGADFDSLSWFSNVELYLLRERNTALQAIQDSKKDEKLQQANTLTARRLLDVLHEFQLVRYNLSSARIFFHQDNAKPANNNAKNTNSD
ncbi:WASH complex subunit 7 [Orchesella cincta]|uniref:WASH complex subunit 7 n=1 Tax=Orchesella cincta TaxID=48709 RepID=A0A1D2N0X0_ORCCI|nr:WASH complex subunit 7 [Orchesella cincta]